MVAEEEDLLDREEEEEDQVIVEQALEEITVYDTRAYCRYSSNSNNITILRWHHTQLTTIIEKL